SDSDRAVCSCLPPGHARCSVTDARTPPREGTSMLLGGELGYRLLRCFPPSRSWLSRLTTSSPPKPGKLEAYWRPAIWDELRGRTVIDFGCSTGSDAITMASHGAERVIGIDIVEVALEVAARAAQRANVADRCTFCTSTNEKADCI